MRGLHSMHTAKLSKNSIYNFSLSPKFYASLHHHKFLSDLSSIPTLSPWSLLDSLSKYLQAQKCLFSDLPSLYPHLFHPSANQKGMSLNSSSFKDQGEKAANINLIGGFLGEGTWTGSCCVFFSYSILTFEKWMHFFYQIFLPLSSSEVARFSFPKGVVVLG